MSAQTSIRRLWRCFVPLRCALCQSVTEARAALCTSCRAILPMHNHYCVCCLVPLPHPAVERCGACLIRPKFTHTCATARYSAGAKQLVGDFKYRDRPGLAHTLALLMVEKLLRTSSILPDVVVPIPLHPSRLAQRGYNQAALLSRECARLLKVQHDPSLLRRIRRMRQQASLSREERRQQTYKSMRACRKLPAHTRVAVVDDVLTSGYTCLEAVRALRASGVVNVQIWVFAYRPYGAEERT